MVSDRIYATLRLDHADEPRVSPVQVNEQGRPFVFVNVGQELALWGHDAARLRQLAQALTTAAESIDAHVPAAETVTS